MRHGAHSSRCCQLWKEAQHLRLKSWEMCRTCCPSASASRFSSKTIGACSPCGWGGSWPPTITPKFAIMLGCAIGGMLAGFSVCHQAQATWPAYTRPMAISMRWKGYAAHRYCKYPCGEYQGLGRWKHETVPNAAWERSIWTIQAGMVAQERVILVSSCNCILLCCDGS